MSKKDSTQKKSQKFSKIAKNLGWQTLFSVALFALIYVSIFLSAFVVSFIMAIILRDKITLPVWTTVYQAVTYIGAVALILFLLPKLAQAVGKIKSLQKVAQKDPLTLAQKNTRDSLGLTGLPTWTDIGLAPIAFVVALIIGALLTAIFSAIFPWFNAEQTQEIGYSTTIMGLDRIYAFVAICIVAPIAEELLFRGWLYGKQRTKLGAIFAIILNAIFFGLMHGQWNVALTVGAMGATACFLREITGTIYAGILLHVLKNTIAFLLLFTLGL